MIFKTLPIIFGMTAYSCVAHSIAPIPEIPQLPETISYGHTFYVNNIEGVNSEENGSELNQWKTLPYALKRIHEGDTLIIEATSEPYDASFVVFTESGQGNNWIQIGGKSPEEKPIIHGRITLGDGSINTVRYIALRNLKFEGPGGSGMNLKIGNGSKQLIFEGIEVDCKGHNENSRGIWTGNNTRYIWFKDVAVKYCGHGRVDPTDCSGLCIKGDYLDNIVLLNVQAIGNKGDGIGGGSKKSLGRVYVKDSLANSNTGDGFDLSGNNLNVVINSISQNNGGDQGAGFKFWGRESWLVYSVAYNNAHQGVVIRPRHNGESRLYVLNSTLARNNPNVYGGQIGTSSEEPEDGELNIYLYNNIFHAFNTSAVVLHNINKQVIKEEGNNYYFSEVDQSQNPHWVYRHAVHYRDGELNVVDGYEFPEMQSGGRWSEESYKGGGDIGQVESEGLLDPGFVDLESGDLRLKEDSEAVDAGIDLGIDFDIEGNPVPGGNAVDMGAYERI